MGTARKVAVGVAALRIVYATGLLAAPGRVARTWVGTAADSPGGAIALRGLGARDLVLSAGVAFCAWSGRDARPWLAGCAASAPPIWQPPSSPPALLYPARPSRER